MQKIMEKEIWKEALGYEGVLEVSNLGRVKRLPFINYTSYKNPRHYKGCLLKPFFCGKKNGIGYAMIEINKKNISVHRLIASTFIKNIEIGYVVNHINNNTIDNNISNLEIVSNLENIRHGKLNRDNFTSKYIGVCLYGNNKYRTSLMHKGLLYQKQGFKTEDEAYLYLTNLRERLGIISKY